MKKALIAVCLLGVLSVNSFAAPVMLPTGGTPTMLITSIQVFTGSWSEPNNTKYLGISCSLSPYCFYIPFTDESYKSVLTLALYAKNMDIHVKIFYDGAVTKTFGGAQGTTYYSLMYLQLLE